jgi:pimeloyl-ACP methyl ester carboxylesterase
MNFFSFLSVIFLAFSSFTQDLVVSSLVSPNPSGFTIQKGQLLNFSFTVKNQGTLSSTSSKVQFLLAQDIIGTNAFPIAEVAVEVLSPTQMTSSNYFQYVVPENFVSGNYFLFSKVDPFNQVNESNESNNYLVYSGMPLNFSTSAVTERRTLAYPMIFIHGLNSSAETWVDFSSFYQKNHSFQFGGQFDFCLNQDNVLETGSLSDVHDHTVYTSLSNGDFFYLNFDVDPDGTRYGNTVQSNQSAIAKQGEALRRVVDSVLLLTGASKVHLVGHSMGGLCSRDFIQKYDLDASKTAKLSTIFTPHGGSNSTALGLGFIVGLDESSEAIRDLRYTYSTDYHGVYLFGGYEDPFYIDNTFFDFYNVDVNADDEDFDFLMGINNMPIPTEEKMDFAAVIGDGSTFGGDGVVAAERANIMNYVDVLADTFVIQNPSYFSITDVLHTEGLIDPNSFPTFLNALDETDKLDLAWPISTNTLYSGRVDKKGGGEVDIIQGESDFDFFKLNLEQNGTLNLQVSNIPVSDFTVNLLDELGQVIASVSSQGKGTLGLNEQLSFGNYFLQFISEADSTSFLNSYFFKANFVINATSISETQNEKLSIYPNPVENKLFVSGLNQSIGFDFEIFSLDGRLIQSGTSENLNDGISVSELQNGTYFLRINHQSITYQFIKL